MSAVREKDSADFDLEAFIDLFDEALTSDDPGVQKTLQHLMVIAALARNHAQHDHRDGPMRRMFENQRDIIRRLESLEMEKIRFGGGSVPLGPYVPSTYVPSTPWPGTGGGTIWPPQPGTYPPGTIWAQGGTSSGTTNTSSSAIVQRVDELLKDEKYKGSSIAGYEPR